MRSTATVRWREMRHLHAGTNGDKRGRARPTTTCAVPSTGRSIATVAVWTHETQSRHALLPRRDCAQSRQEENEDAHGYEAAGQSLPGKHRRLVVERPRTNAHQHAREDLNTDGTGSARMQRGVRVVAGSNAAVLLCNSNPSRADCEWPGGGARLCGCSARWSYHEDEVCDEQNDFEQQIRRTELRCHFLLRVDVDGGGVSLDDVGHGGDGEAGGERQRARRVRVGAGAEGAAEDGGGRDGERRRRRELEQWGRANRQGERMR